MPLSDDLQNPAPNDVRRIFLLPCPKCGIQIEATADRIGTVTSCECGQQYRLALVIQKLPIEDDSVWLRGQRGCIAFWKCCTDTWQQSIWPRTVAFCQCVRDKWFPWAVDKTQVAYGHFAKWFKSLFGSTNSIDAIRSTSAAGRPVAAALISAPSETEGANGDVPDEVDDEPVSVKDFFSLTSAPSVSEQPPSESTSESQKLYRLANQMIVAGLYEDAYTHASQAVVLDPSNAGAWAAKGIASAYASKPPEFRLKETRMCLTESLKSAEVKEFMPSLQQHLLRASSNYRKLLRQACQDADDDAQREPLAGNVDVGLQLTLRNKRVARVQTQKHRDGYFSSIDTIRYAAGLNPTFHALELGLREIDNVLSKDSFPGFVNFLSEDGKRDQIVRMREGFIGQIREIRPSFTPPEIPRASGCFIATAAAGDEFHPSVCTLRRFRDQILLPNSIGRKFVRTYYLASPPLASVISQSNWLRHVVRIAVVGPSSTFANYALSKMELQSVHANLAHKEMDSTP